VLEPNKTTKTKSVGLFQIVLYSMLENNPGIRLPALFAGHHNDESFFPGGGGGGGGIPTTGHIPRILKVHSTRMDPFSYGR
jgi:hypothetical protein